MVKIEAFFKLHFMHQVVRVCRTDHTDSIIARIACSFLLKYVCFMNLIRNCTLLWVGLGMVKIEAFFKLHFMHQVVRVCRTDHTDSIIARIACSFLLKQASGISSEIAL